MVKVDEIVSEALAVVELIKSTDDPDKIFRERLWNCLQALQQMAHDLGADEAEAICDLEELYYRIVKRLDGRSDDVRNGGIQRG